MLRTYYADAFIDSQNWQSYKNQYIGLTFNGKSKRIPTVPRQIEQHFYDNAAHFALFYVFSTRTLPRSGPFCNYYLNYLVGCEYYEILCNPNPLV